MACAGSGVERTMAKHRCEVMGQGTHYLKLGIVYDGNVHRFVAPGVATMLRHGHRTRRQRSARLVARRCTGRLAVSAEMIWGPTLRKRRQDTSSASFFMESRLQYISTDHWATDLYPRPAAPRPMRAPLPNQNMPDYSLRTPWCYASHCKDAVRFRSAHLSYCYTRAGQCSQSRMCPRESP